MVYTAYSDVNLMTNLTSNDVSNDDIDSIIIEATKELNRLINVQVVRERVEYVDSTRENEIDGTNTTYYIKNWKGKFLADMNNDGDVDTDDIIIYSVASDGTETKLTGSSDISSIDVSACSFTLATAPDNVTLYVTYEWCYKDPYTPDPLIKLACTLLSSAYCYAKVNIGRAPQINFGNMRIYRHMASFDHYYKRFLTVVTQINGEMADIVQMENIL